VAFIKNYKTIFIILLLLVVIPVVFESETLFAGGGQDPGGPKNENPGNDKPVGGGGGEPTGDDGGDDSDGGSGGDTGSGTGTGSDTDQTPTTPTPAPQQPTPPQTIPDSVITGALNDDNPSIKLEEGDPTTISEDELQAIRDSGKTIEIELPNGVVVSIDPDTITDGARAIDLNIGVIITSQATTVNNTVVPANSIVLAPPTHGEFGFVLNIHITAQLLADAGLNGANVRFFYISSTGVVTEQSRITRNADGSVTISIDRASQYVLSSTPPVRTGGAPQTGDYRTILLPLIMITLGSLGIGGLVFHNRRMKKAEK